jgi:hypothetical protein
MTCGRACSMVARDGAQVEHVLRQRDHAAGHARDVEQVVEQAGHVADLAFDDGAGLAQALLAGLAGLEDLGRHADRGERIAQFVRQHRQEFVLAAVGLAQLGFGGAAEHQFAFGALVGGLQFAPVDVERGVQRVGAAAAFARGGGVAVGGQRGAFDRQLGAHQRQQRADRRQQRGAGLAAEEHDDRRAGAVGDAERLRVAVAGRRRQRGARAAGTGALAQEGLPARALA